MPIEKKSFNYDIQPEAQNTNEFLENSLVSYEEIMSSLETLGIDKTWPKAYFIIGNHLHELIKNCIDSFIEASEHNQKFFHGKINVIINSNNESLHVKIKDNGKGLSFFSKGETKNARDVVTQLHLLKNKDPTKYLGGQKLGLSKFLEDIENAGGKLSIKNRKDAGCTVSMRFSKK